MHSHRPGGDVLACDVSYTSLPATQGHPQAQHIKPAAAQQPPHRPERNRCLCRTWEVISCLLTALGPGTPSCTRHRGAPTAVFRLPLPILPQRASLQSQRQPLSMAVRCTHLGSSVQLCSGTGEVLWQSSTSQALFILF